MDQKEKEQIAKNLKLADRVVRAIDEDKKFRISCIKNTAAAQIAQERHELPAIPAFFLAKTMSAASMAASFLKGQERMIIDVGSNGHISRIYAEAVQAGEIRGFVDYRPDISNVRIEKLENILGVGLFRVARIKYDEPEPITGIVPLQKGDIETDLSYFFNQSDQIPSAVLIDVELSDEGKIAQSGGLIVQAMPGATKDEIAELHNSLRDARKLTEIFAEEKTPVDAMKELLPFETNVVKSTRLDFFCRCSKDGFKAKLLTLSAEEIKDMRDKGDNELVCNFCNEKYLLEDSDFDEIIEEIESKKN